MPEPLELGTVTDQETTNSYALALSASPCGNDYRKLVFSFENTGSNSLSYKFVAIDVDDNEHTYKLDTALAASATNVEIAVLGWKRVDMYVKSTATDQTGKLTGCVFLG